MKRMRLNFIFWMLVIAFGIAILLFPITAAYADPTNPGTKHLVIDTITGPAPVIKSDVQDNEASYPEAQCIYDPQNGETRVYFLENVAAGDHVFRVRVYYGEYTTQDNGGATVHPEQWSGWSNELSITKPYALTLSILNGYLVAPFQDGMIASNVYIDDTNYTGTVEPTTDGQYLRLYDVRGFSPGTYNIWANVTYSVDGVNDGVNEWEGDYPVNPFVVTIAPAPQAPVNLRIQ